MDDNERRLKKLEVSLIESLAPLKNFDEDQCMELLTQFLSIEEHHLRENVVDYVSALTDISRKARLQ